MAHIYQKCILHVHIFLIGNGQKIHILLFQCKLYAICLCHQFLLRNLSISFFIQIVLLGRKNREQNFEDLQRSCKYMLQISLQFSRSGPTRFLFWHQLKYKIGFSKQEKNLQNKSKGKYFRWDVDLFFWYLNLKQFLPVDLEINLGDITLNSGREMHEHFSLRLLKWEA